MRKLYLIMIVCFSIVSCSEQPKAILESKAKETFKVSFSEFIEDEKDVNIDNIKTVFSNDSLCILHIDIKSKNKLGVEVSDKLEYLFISKDGIFYEAFQDLEKDSIFVSQPTLNKIKKGLIYENLNYDEAIFYRSVMSMNMKGREVGNHDASFKLPVPTGTGLWELDASNDEFGDKTSEKFLRLTSFGKFSNSAATNDDLVVFLFADKEDIYFRFVEYGSSVVKADEYFDMKIKDSKGDIHNLRFYGTESGYIGPSVYAKGCAEEFKKIIEMEGEISVRAEEAGEYSRSVYQFKLDLDGYNKAFTFL